MKEVKLIFGVTSLASLVLALIPISLFLAPFSVSEQSFSEIWILNINNTAYNYPTVITEDEPITVNIGARNHMNRLMLYAIYVKLRNQTQQLPATMNLEPSNLEPIYEFLFPLPNEGIWESTINFSVLEASPATNNSMNVTEVLTNGIAYEGSFVAEQNSDQKGHYFQLVLELWYFDDASNQFRFDNRFVDLWLLFKVQ